MSPTTREALLFDGTTTSTITRANLNGTGAENLHLVDAFGAPIPSHPSGIALDVAGGKMYMTSDDNDDVNSRGTVIRANLDGTGAESLGDFGFTLIGLRGIALDLRAEARKIYVVISFQPRDPVTGNVINPFGNVVKANMADGGSPGNINLGGLNEPYGITLDVAGGFVYVTNQGDHTIVRGHMNNAPGIPLGDFGGMLVRPAGIALGPEPSIVTPPIGAPPIVNAGADQTLTSGALGSVTATLEATITPPGPANYLWTDALGRQLPGRPLRSRLESVFTLSPLQRRMLPAPRCRTR